MKRYVNGTDGTWSTAIDYKCIDANLNDTLVFAVTSNHNLIQMANADAYDGCDFNASTTLAGVGSGEAVVPLSEVGAYYFSCSIGLHCSNNHEDHGHIRHLGEGSEMYPQKIFVMVDGDTPCKDMISAAPATLGAGIANPMFILGISFLWMLRKIMS